MPLSDRMKLHATVRITNEMKNGSSNRNRKTDLKLPAVERDPVRDRVGEQQRDARHDRRVADRADRGYSPFCDSASAKFANRNVWRNPSRLFPVCRDRLDHREHRDHEQHEQPHQGRRRKSVRRLDRFVRRSGSRYARKIGLKMIVPRLDLVPLQHAVVVQLRGELGGREHVGAARDRLQHLLVRALGRRRRPPARSPRRRARAEIRVPLGEHRRVRRVVVPVHQHHRRRPGSRPCSGCSSCR